MQNNHKKFVQTKGFYILLTALVLVIGVSSYAFLSDASEQQKEVKREGVSVPQNAQQTMETEDTAPTMQHSEETGLGHGKQTKTVMPVSGQVLQEYAMERLTYNTTTKDWRTHDGVDLAAPVGTQVVAAKSGTVMSVKEDAYYGMTVSVQHDDGFVTSYSGLAEEVAVQPEERVEAGQVIGTVADTTLIETAMDSHLHFAVSKDGVSVDPAGFLYQ